MQVTVSAPIITKVATCSKYTKIPFPEGSHFQIPALCSLFGVTPRTLWNRLSDHREKFDPPMYRRVRNRKMRLLTERDYETLRNIFAVYVKR